MPQTDKPTVVSQYIYDLLTDNKQELGIEDVFDGDQELIPRTPAICVLIGDYGRELTGAPFRTDNAFTIYLMVYHAKIQDNQLNYRECNELAEAVMDLMHQNKTLGDNVIHGFVTSIEPGYVRQGRSLSYVSRLTWYGLTKTLT